MLVGRGLERLDRSRSHHILSQEEVIVILCANNINLGGVKLLFIEFQCQTGYMGSIRMDTEHCPVDSHIF